jgi:hypothetical protein
LVFCLAAAPSLAAGKVPVVVELFTSQGCNSCPPADALLGELAGRDDVIALSLHVDYWDYIGWADPFASSALTQRQRDYARERGTNRVYTPQIIVDGRYPVIGSRRRQVYDALGEAAEQSRVVRPVIEERRVLIPAGHAPGAGAVIWLVVFDDVHSTPVKRGENAGRQIDNYHVVRRWENLGTWTGPARELAVDLASERAAGRGGAAVILQQAGVGPVIGAAQLRF